MRMKTSMLIVTVVMAGAAASALAQTTVTFQVNADTESRVQGFDSALRAAIVKAGGQLAERARQVAPNIQLQFESDARIKGIVLPEGEGIQFFIDVPGIRPDTVGQWELSRLLNSRSEPVVPVANGNATRVPHPAGPTDSVLMTNPVKEYSDFTHDALVDTMLDNGFMLPLASGQSLTLIIGNGTSGLLQNPLAEKPKLLYLRVKADDLIALRQNRITREEAKNRIRQWVY